MKFEASTLRIDFSFQPDGAAIASGRTVTARIDDHTEQVVIASLVIILVFIATLLFVWRDVILSASVIVYGIVFNLFMLKVTIGCLAESAAKLTMRPQLAYR